MFANITAMGKQAWSYITGPSCKPFHFFGLVETRVKASKDLQHWRGEAAEAERKIIQSPARPTGWGQTEATRDRANGGGEW